MQQLFSKETFMHTALELRSGEEGDSSRAPGWQNPALKGSRVPVQLRTCPQKQPPSSVLPQLCEEARPLLSCTQMAGTPQL